MAAVFHVTLRDLEKIAEDFSKRTSGGTPVTKPAALNIISRTLLGKGDWGRMCQLDRDKPEVLSSRALSQTAQKPAVELLGTQEDILQKDTLQYMRDSLRFAQPQDAKIKALRNTPFAPSTADLEGRGLQAGRIETFGSSRGGKSMYRLQRAVYLDKPITLRLAAPGTGFIQELQTQAAAHHMELLQYRASLLDHLDALIISEAEFTEPSPLTLPRIGALPPSSRDKLLLIDDLDCCDPQLTQVFEKLILKRLEGWRAETAAEREAGPQEMIRSQTWRFHTVIRISDEQRFNTLLCEHMPKLKEILEAQLR